MTESAKSGADAHMWLLDGHQAHLAAIVEAVRMAVISVDESQQVVLFNPEAERIFRCSAADALGASLDRFIPASARAAHHEHLKRYDGSSSEHGSRHMGGEHGRHMGGERILTGLRADGEEFPIDATILRTDVAGQQLNTVILRDVSERMRLLQQQRQAESDLRESRDRLRELSSALQTIREEEKTRIARELHDELGQALTALKMDAAAIENELDHAQDALRKRTADMKQLIDATVGAVRRISADLRPVMLDNLGLVPTLEWLTRDFSKRTGIAVDLDIPDENLGVAGDAATAIFRITQEALTNVSRHAGADHVTVSVQRRGGIVVVRIADNGKGFTEADARKVRSFGMLGMRERAYVLGGDLTVKSTPGGGTQIEAVIPRFGTAQGETP